MSSIRSRLLWRLSLGALVLLLSGAGLLYAGVRWLLTDQFDASLRTKLSTFSTLIEQDGWDIEIGFVEQAMPEFSAEVDPEYIELWPPPPEDEEWQYRSPSLGEGHLPKLAGTEAEPIIWDLELPDGRAGRAIGASFDIHQYTPDPEDPEAVRARITLVLAKGRGNLDRALAMLLGGTAGGILLWIGAGTILVRRAVMRGLRPLQGMAGHVSAIDDPLLAPRFPLEGLPEELAPLAESHNQMLERIRAAFERERRATANIAHELRTPVTELLILAETAERYPTDAGETARRLGELREIGVQMSDRIATLLELARMESGHVLLEIESVDLAEMVRDCWSPLSAAAAARGQTFEIPLGQGPLVKADRAALSILLANLLGNAVAHAPAGDRIACDVQNGNGRCSLVLSNAANALSPRDLDKLTEPFWRASAAREDRSHAGIGLSLAGRLAELLGLELRFAIEGGLFRARLSFAAG